MPKILAGSEDAVVVPGFLLVSVLLATSFCGQAGRVLAQQVEVSNGDVVYTDARGEVRKVTSSGMDSFASLSFDGKTIIFVRKTQIPAHLPEGPSPFDTLVPNQTQIWTVNIDGGSAKLTFAGPAVLKDGSEYVSFAVPKLSPDNRYAYFWIPRFVVESTLVRLDLKTKETTTIADGLDYFVVGSGRYSGDLVVQMRKPVGETVPGGGVSRFYWLLTPEGKELGFVGESDKDALRFLGDPNRMLGKYPVGKRRIRDKNPGQRPALNPSSETEKPSDS